MPPTNQLVDTAIGMVRHDDLLTVHLARFLSDANSWFPLFYQVRIKIVECQSSFYSIVVNNGHRPLLLIRTSDNRLKLVQLRSDFDDMPFGNHPFEVKRNFAGL